MMIYAARTILAIGVGMTLFPASWLTPAKAQTAGDVVVIGDTASKQAALEAYWDQLSNLRRPPLQPPAPFQSFAQPVENPQVLEQEIIRKLRLGKLELKPIIGLGGASQVQGTLTNTHNQPVNVSAVNYEIFDSGGTLIQTGSAAPAPATLQPGQTVTFKDSLLTTSVFGKQVRLANPAIILSGPSLSPSGLSGPDRSSDPIIP